MIIRQDKQSIRREGQKCAMRNLEEEEKKKNTFQLKDKKETLRRR